MSPRAQVVVVTGLSGAGKSTALHALEDLGYFCVDNLPTSLAEHSVEVCEAGGIYKIALGIDVRVGSFLEGAAEALQRMRDGERNVVVLFLDASDEALLRRFNETRRPHPLSARTSAPPAGATRPGDAPAPSGRTLAVIDGVHLERARLAPLRASADIDLDTTLLSVHELRREVIARLDVSGERPRMMTRFVSFGFKYGMPMDADLVFDVRFLDNPYFVPELRPLAGTDQPIIDYILNNPEAVAYVDKLYDLLAFSLPRYEREGKSYLTIAIGCTGGRHRSVVLAEHLAKRLQDASISVVHRDVLRASSKGGRGPSQGGGGGSGQP